MGAKPPKYRPPEQPGEKRLTLECLAVLVVTILALLQCGRIAEDEKAVGPGHQTETKPAQRDAKTASKSPGLPPAQRFTEYPEEHPYRPVQDALNAGNIHEAIVLFGGRDTIATPDTARERRMLAAIQKASDEEMGHDEAATFADHIDAYWLPELRELKPPTQPRDVSVVRAKFEDYARSLADAESLALSDSQKRRREAFVAALSAKQAEFFPLMRRLTRSALGPSLFRADVEVELVGPSASTIRFVSYRFASNASINDMFKGMYLPLRRLRFKKAVFGTSVGSRYTYDLDVPADRAIGYWNEQTGKFIRPAEQ